MTLPSASCYDTCRHISQTQFCSILLCGFSEPAHLFDPVEGLVSEMSRTHEPYWQSAVPAGPDTCWLHQTSRCTHPDVFRDKLRGCGLTQWSLLQCPARHRDTPSCDSPFWGIITQSNTWKRYQRRGKKLQESVRNALHKITTSKFYILSTDVPVSCLKQQY